VKFPLSGTLKQRVALGLAAIISVSTLSACSPAPVEASFLGNAEVGGWTRAPEGWSSARLGAADPSRTIEGFWAPGGDASKVLAPNQIPSGLLQRQVVQTPGDAALELAAVNVVFPDATAAGIKEVSRTKVSVGESEGLRIVFEFVMPGGEVTIAQIAVINRDERTVQSIALGCSSLCFKQNQTQIASIIDTWKVAIK